LKIISVLKQKYEIDDEMDYEQKDSCLFELASMIKCDNSIIEVSKKISIILLFDNSNIKNRSRLKKVPIIRYS
jgi:hypothetical protein